MPLYEYHCEDCGRDTELLVTSSAAADCPACGSSRMSKLLSIVAVPSREGSSSREPPSGSCGAGCGCHPHG